MNLFKYVKFVVCVLASSTLCTSGYAEPVEAYVEPQYTLVYEVENGPVNSCWVNQDLREEPESEEDFIARMAAGYVPEGLHWIVAKTSELPAQAWWAAWRLSDDKVIVDMDVAREIQMAKIRVLRNVMLRDLDLDSLRALEDNEQAELGRIKELKKELRSLPQTLDLSSATLEELEHTIPSLLQEISDEFKDDLRSGMDWREISKSKGRQRLYY